MASVASCGNRLTPIEADVKNSTPPRSNGSWSASWTRVGHRLGDEEPGSVPATGPDAALEIGEQQQELVPTLPRDEVGVTGASAQPLRELLEQLVAGVVPERVVHELEVVEVEVEHADAEVVAAGAGDRRSRASPRTAPGSASR